MYYYFTSFSGNMPGMEVVSRQLAANRKFTRILYY